MEAETRRSLDRLKPDLLEEIVRLKPDLLEEIVRPKPELHNAQSLSRVHLA